MPSLLDRCAPVLAPVVAMTPASSGGLAFVGRFAWAFVGFAVLVLIGCGAPLLAEVPLSAPGSYDAAIEHDDGERSFRLHLPPGFDSTSRRPLLVVLHGGGSSGEGMEEVTGFSRIADREGFFVVYPNGEGGPHGLGRAWNAGSCCGPPSWFGVDDVGFIGALVDQLSERFPIDPQRVFLVGYSNGGMLAYRIALDLSHRFAGLAVYAATMVGRGSVTAPEFESALPTHPLSVITVHSYADPWVPYQGEEDWFETDVSNRHAGQFWAAVARCPTRAKRSIAHQGALLIRQFRDCPSGVEVEQLTLHDWDHEWPGPANLADLEGHRLQTFDAAERIWAFFADKQRAAQRGNGGPVVARSARAADDR